jgi:hypothetical protein
VTLRRPPAWLILLAIVVYGGLFVLFLRNPGNSVKADSQAYLQLAFNLRTHHVFSSASAPPFTPDVYRLPGYPLFLAVTSAITPSSIHFAIALQSLMGILLVFIVWRFWYRRSGPMGAFLGTFFLCFDLMAVLHQDLILTEALYTLIFTIALCSALRYVEYPTMRRAAVTGLLFSIAAFIKPIAIAPAIIFLLCSYKNWKSAIWLGFFILSLPLCWMARNWTLTGYPVYTIQGNVTLLQYPAARVLAKETGRTRLQVLQDQEAKLRRDGFGEGTNPIVLSFAYKRLAFQLIKQYPLEALRYCLIGVMRTLFGTGLEMIVDQIPLSSKRVLIEGTELRITGAGTWSLLKAYPALIPIQAFYTTFILAGYLLFGKGIKELVRKREFRLAVFMAFSVLAILLISTLPGAYYRLRIPLLPFIAFGVASAFPSRNPSDERQNS